MGHKTETSSWSVLDNRSNLANSVRLPVRSLGAVPSGS